MRIDNKVAIVTGGGDGIGKGISLILAQAGATVAVADINLKSAEEVATEIKNAGGHAMAIEVDVSKSLEVDQMVQTVVDSLGTLDILVNNAGVSTYVLPEQETEADFDRMIAVNLKGTYLCCQAAGKHMMKQRSGRIINIASAAGHQGYTILCSYSASKGGVLALTRELGVSWSRYNINVNSVSPGSTLTGIAAKSGNWDPEKISPEQEMMLNSIPLGRVNDVDDIANAVLFLASPGARNITARDILVDGGSCAMHPSAFVTTEQFLKESQVNKN